MKQPAIFLVKLCISGMLLAAIAWAQTGDDWRIDTFAGGPAIGDGGPVAEALFRDPNGVAVDGAGNLYIADTKNRRIRKVDTTGTITTIAGTGEYGFSGDGGPAAEAQLSGPSGVAVDGAGNVYIADRETHRIRKVDTTGTITTIAGTGEYGFSGDGGPAAEAQLGFPNGVAVDGAGNVYIADRNNARIRKVDTTGTITTIAGTEHGFSGDGGPAAEAQIGSPYGVAVDGAGNVYIADSFNQRIRKVDTTGTITTIAGTGERGFSGDGGPAAETQLNLPYGVVVDGAGNLYIGDLYNDRIRKVDTTGKITTIAGTGESGFSGDGGPAAEAQLSDPTGVAMDGAGNLYIADTENHRIRKVDSMGTITTIAGTGERGDGGPAAEVQLSDPTGVAMDGAGNLYIAERDNHRIRKVNSAGTITTIAGTGVLSFGGDGGPAAGAQLGSPTGVAMDGAGNLYIADTENHRIRKVDSTGTITTIAGTGEYGFGGDGGPAAEAQLSFPAGVAVDGAGNLYIADTENHRIRKVDLTGTITTIAGTGEYGFSGDGGPAAEAQIGDPFGVAVDVAGNLYIADLGNQRIRKVDSTGTITTIAGTGEYGFGGDGGPAAEAQLSFPFGVAVDGAGNLYIADRDNQRIRKLTPGGSGSFTDAQHEGTALSATLTGLSPDTVYEVQVRASTATGTGEWSESGEGKTSPLPTGDQIYYFPHLAVGASWQTTITYINYSSEEVTCQTDFLSDDGTPLMVSFAGRGAVPSRTDILLPGGSVHQETNVALSAPLARGWARATCSGPVKASLLFRQHSSEGAPVAEAGVNAATVPATRFVTFAEQGEGQFGTGVAYANPSATAALVTFTARDTAGEVLPSVNRILSPGGHAAHGMSELFDLTSFTGSIEVTSTEPIVSLSLNFEADPVFSSLPPGELDASAQGSTTYYFPHLAVGASWQTTITYINYSPQEVTCQTDFLSDHGTPLMVSFAGRGAVPSRTDVLPPGGSVHQETNVDLSAPLAPGWARATCSGPVKASLLYRQRNSEGAPTAEAGVNAAAVPATRFVTFAEQGEGQFGTGVAYANPSDTSATVTFTARDAAGQVLASVDRMLSPGGHGAHGMLDLFGLPSFTGSLEVTSTEPIVSLSINFEADPVFSSLPPGDLDAAPAIPGEMPAPDLVVQIPFAPVSDSAPAAGANFTLSVTVRNVGDEEAAATTLRYYRSNDTTISSSDTPVGRVAVSALPASGTSAESIPLTAPSSAGTYYYGACVDPVSGESDTGNNCSSAARVTVSASQIGSAGFDLAAINRSSPEGIVFANDRFFVVDGRPWVYAYTASGQHDAASGFALDSANFHATGITFANNRFFVADWPGNKVYAYQSTGQRDAPSDFALDSDNMTANGITFANNRFYVVDLVGNKVYAYQSSGQRDAASDFDLDP